VKKFFALSLVFAVALFAASAVAAPPASTSTPVILRAVVPEFLSIQSSSAPQVNFNFDPANPNWANGDNQPAYLLKYNLTGEPVTVYAFATPLVGQTDSSHVIPPAAINALVAGKTLTFNGTVLSQNNAILLDTIPNAIQQTGKTVAFQGMFLVTSGTPLVDTYQGTMTFVAQAQ
jgi:hypothetical protein